MLPKNSKPRRNSRKMRTALSKSLPRSRLPDKNCCSVSDKSVSKLGNDCTETLELLLSIAQQPSFVMKLTRFFFVDGVAPPRLATADCTSSDGCPSKSYAPVNPKDT